MSDKPSTLLAYIDEAGARGLVRDLKSTRDSEIGLMCALVFESGTHERAIERFTPGFNAFHEAKPPNAKLHVTDAFAEGNEAWRPIAEKVREDFLSLFLIERPTIVYTARRCRLSRLAHEQQGRIPANKPIRRSTISINGENRPSDWRIEDDLIECLALLLDAYGETKTQNGSVAQVNLIFDEIDKAVVNRYEAMINRTKAISHSSERVQGWDSTARKTVTGAIETTIDADFPLDTRYLGGVRVVGKHHPLVLAADIATNHLYHHLSQLTDGAPLNAPTSLAGWRLEELVIGTREDASEDLL
jgi:hypothetical protein